MTFWVGGVRISINFFLVALVSAVLMMDRHGVFLLLLLAMMIHEAGHLTVMTAFGLPIRAVEASLTGFRIYTETVTMQEGRMLLLQSAGCLANLAAASLVLGMQTFAMQRFSAINAALALINLLPVEGLDGGEILYRLLLILTDEHCAYFGSRAVEWGAAILAAFAAVWLLLREGFGPLPVFLLSIAIWGIFALLVES